MALYAYAQGAQAVAPGGVVSLGTAMRCGCSEALDGSAVTLLRPGLYRFDATLTGTTDAAGTLSVQARVDGADVPGAQAAETVGVAGDLCDLSLTFFVRAGCCRMCRPAVDIVSTGGAATYDNVAITVARIA